VQEAGEEGPKPVSVAPTDTVLAVTGASSQDEGRELCLEERDEPVDGGLTLEQAVSGIASMCESLPQDLRRGPLRTVGMHQPRLTLPPTRAFPPAPSLRLRTYVRGEGALYYWAAVDAHPKQPGARQRAKSPVIPTRQ
jgi:hypothetical protein